MTPHPTHRLTTRGTAHERRPAYGFDIETDTTRGGLDPATSRIIAIGIAGDGWERSFTGREADVLAETDAFLAQLPPGHLVTWNGAGFDFPFVWDRAIAAGVALDLYLSPDPGILLPHGPPAGHRLAYRVRWGAHDHIDAYLELRPIAHRIAGSARLKPFAALHGIDCLEHDYARLPSLSASALERYVASDARATLRLAERYGLTGSLVGAP
ncbi:MAG: ribonuclease H-like domain-containing protein [Acidimicrobiales bacterium]|nr:ribonuclease H-like domain-containing protein [Acidimicrobiales bacterium]